MTRSLFALVLTMMVAVAAAFSVSDNSQDSFPIVTTNGTIVSAGVIICDRLPVVLVRCDGSNIIVAAEVLKNKNAGYKLIQGEEVRVAQGKLQICGMPRGYLVPMPRPDSH